MRTRAPRRRARRAAPRPCRACGCIRRRVGQRVVAEDPHVLAGHPACSQDADAVLRHRRRYHRLFGGVPQPQAVETSIFAFPTDLYGEGDRRRPRQRRRSGPALGGVTLAAVYHAGAGRVPAQPSPARALPRERRLLLPARRGALPGPGPPAARQPARRGGRRPGAPRGSRRPARSGVDAWTVYLHVDWVDEALPEPASATRSATRC